MHAFLDAELMTRRWLSNALSCTFAARKACMHSLSHPVLMYDWWKAVLTFIGCISAPVGQAHPKEGLTGVQPLFVPPGPAAACTFPHYMAPLAQLGIL